MATDEALRPFVRILLNIMINGPLRARHVDGQAQDKSIPRGVNFDGQRADVPMVIASNPNISTVLGLLDRQRYN